MWLVREPHVMHKKNLVLAAGKARKPKDGSLNVNSYFLLYVLNCVNHLDDKMVTFNQNLN